MDCSCWKGNKSRKGGEGGVRVFVTRTEILVVFSVEKF